MASQSDRLIPGFAYTLLDCLDWDTADRATIPKRRHRLPNCARSFGEKSIGQISSYRFVSRLEAIERFHGLAAKRELLLPEPQHGAETVLLALENEYQAVARASLPNLDSLQRMRSGLWA